MPTDERGGAVTMLTAPVIAFAPQVAEAGPRTTSIWAMSSWFTVSESHSTAPKKSRYTLRPSTSTSCEFAAGVVAPRLVSARSRAENWTTFTPGTARSISATPAAGLVEMRSADTTEVVTGASARRTGVREAVTTTVSPNPASARGSRSSERDP